MVVPSGFTSGSWVRTASKVASGLFALILHGIELDLIDVAPAPILPRLGGFHDGMSSRVEVFRRVLVLGGIAATDVAARQAEPEMHPLVPGCQALLAAFRV